MKNGFKIGRWILAAFLLLADSGVIFADNWSDKMRRAS